VEDHVGPLLRDQSRDRLGLAKIQLGERDADLLLQPGRVVGLARRQRLSTTSTSFPCFLIRAAALQPMNPAPPVIR